MKIPIQIYGKLTIRKRIYLGFTLICLVLVIFGLGAYWELKAINTIFLRHRLANDANDLQIEVYDSVLKIQKEVLRYMHEGHQSAGEEALKLMSEVRNRLVNARGKLPLGNNELEAIQQMEIRFSNYEKTFGLAYSERQVYGHLLQKQLPDLLQSVEDEIYRTHKNQVFDHGPELDLLHLHRSWIHLLTYFERLDATYRSLAQAELRSLVNHINEHDLSASSSETNSANEYTESIKKSLIVYEKEVNRAVQATRGYLFLINVVMAGEASEILYLSDVLKRNAVEAKADLRAELDSLIRRVVKVILLMVSAMCLFAIAYAFWLARMVTNPLTKIRDTFLLLGKGETVNEFPGIERSDEIGDLAHAANLFREKNEETNELLKKADQLSRDLESNQRLLLQSHADMEEFVYTVSHDLKSPIVTSTGFIGIIKELASQKRYEEALSKLDRVEKANLRMGVLINDLLELSRAGRVDRHYTVLDMNRLLSELKDSMEMELNRKGFELILKGPFPPVYGDWSQITQVFENLLSNALKYGQSEESPSCIEISIQKEADMQKNCFIVRDFGKGIPEKFREKIFSLFARLEKTKEGTGIGLTIVRKLIRLHGGEIRAVSPPHGKGACFNIYLDPVETGGEH